MHVISVVASAMFLIFYRWVLCNRENNNFYIISITSKIYVFLYILFGAVSSINSQRYTGNIYSYIILALIAAIAFTLKPSIMLFEFVVNHIIFLIGIGALCNDSHLLLAKLVNSTILAGAAFLIGFIFYRHRMMEFFYRKKLMKSEENFKKLFYANPYPVFITRQEDGKIIEANKRAYNLMGVEAENLDSFNGIDDYMKTDSRLDLEEELKKHSSTFNRIIEYNFNGKRKWVNANYEIIDYNDEKCILTGIMDITEIRKAEEELSHYASIDSLTGIMNRRMGLKKLEELLEEKQFEESNIREEFPYNIMASCGLFYFCTGMDIDLDQIIEKADKMMYEEKQRFKKEHQTNDEMERKIDNNGVL